MKKKHYSKWKYEQFDDDKDFDGDIEEEIEVEEEDNIDKIAKKNCFIFNKNIGIKKLII